MITIPLSLFLIPYGFVVLFFLLLAFINIFHIIHYGATTQVSFIVTFLFLAGAAYILFFTWQTLGGVDWNHEIIIGISSTQGLHPIL